MDCSCPNTVMDIGDAILGCQLDLSSEKVLQSQILDLFSENQIDAEPEYRLSSDDIVDFFINGLAIEVKIKGRANEIYRQCKRYTEHQEVTGLLLITNRSMGFPEQINGKPCYVLTLGKSWL